MVELLFENSSCEPERVLIRVQSKRTSRRSECVNTCMKLLRIECGKRSVESATEIQPGFKNEAFV